LSRKRAIIVACFAVCRSAFGLYFLDAAAPIDAHLQKSEQRG